MSGEWSLSLSLVVLLLLSLDATIQKHVHDAPPPPTSPPLNLNCRNPDRSATEYLPRVLHATLLPHSFRFAARVVPAASTFVATPPPSISLVNVNALEVYHKHSELD
jgi:hypothetical protein